MGHRRLAVDAEQPASVAEVVVGDLTEPQDIVDAMAGTDRMFFSMSVSPDYLKATAIICEAALEYGHLEALVNMSQMTVSQMTLTSVGESHQHRLHYLAEHVLNWSGVPVVHIRPTAFLDNPIFTWLAAPSLRERNVSSATRLMRSHLAAVQRMLEQDPGAM